MRDATRPRWIPVLATTVFLLLLLLFLAFIWVGVRDPQVPLPASDVVFILSMLAFPAAGWLITIKRPHIRLGWIFLTFPIPVAIGAIADATALRMALAGSEVTPALLLIGSGGLSFFGYWMLIGPAIALFPDGRFPGRRSRWALLSSAALLLGWWLIWAVGREMVCVEPFGEGLDPCPHFVANPLSLPMAAGLENLARPLMNVIFMYTIVVSVTTLIGRYRWSSIDVRQQIKWVAWMGALGMISTMALVFGDIFGVLEGDWVDVVGFAPIAFGLPITIGLSILKFRLYDIDRIISRTAAYTLLVLLLVGLYAAGVTLTQLLLPVQSQFGIVLSTLVTAAVFNPLRRRVQRAVDRRFYRSRYDAQQVLDEFSTELRDVVDLEQVQTALLSAAQRTMQPSHLSVWVRELEGDGG